MEYFCYNKSLKVFSRHLRGNSTDAEKIIWSKIRRKQIKNFQFFRQKPIGSFIVDFYCKEAQLVIEIDGGQHYEIRNIEQDKNRDKYFKDLGLKVLKFTNFDILRNIDNVVEKIYKEI